MGYSLDFVPGDPIRRICNPLDVTHVSQKAVFLKICMAGLTVVAESLECVVRMQRLFWRQPLMRKWRSVDVSTRPTPVCRRPLFFVFALLLAELMWVYSADKGKITI